MKTSIMTKFITLVVLVFISFNGSAQQQLKILNAFQYYKIRASTDYTKLVFIVREDKRYTTFETTYLNDWEEAFLVIEKDEIYSVKARYNIFEDAFYINIEGKEKFVYPHLIEGIVFKDRKFVSRKEMIDSGPKDGYYELLSDGEREFLKKHTYAYKVDRNGNVKLKAKKESVYIKNNKGLAEKFDPNSKTFFNNFKERHKEMKTYVKNNSLNLKKMDDLVILFDYYNHVLAN